MKAILVLIAVAVLSGCALGEQIIPEILPTARYCQDVDYSRCGDQVTFAAKCTAPFGGL